LNKITRHTVVLASFISTNTCFTTYLLLVGGCWILLWRVYKMSWQFFLKIFLNGDLHAMNIGFPTVVQLFYFYIQNNN